MSNLDLNIGDWYTVKYSNKILKDSDVRYYEIVEVKDSYKLVVLDAYKNDGSVERTTFTLMSVLFNIQDGTWEFDGNVNKQLPQKHKCKFCGKEEDHTGMVYHPIDGECWGFL